MSDRKFRIKEQTGSDRNRQEQTGTDRNRQDYISDIENYCIIKKFIYQTGNQEVRNRKEQTGINRIIYLI